MIHKVFLIFTLSLEASYLRAAQTEVLFQLGTDTVGQQLMSFSHFLNQVAVVGVGEVLQLRAQASPPCHSTLLWWIFSPHTSHSHTSKITKSRW